MIKYDKYYLEIKKIKSELICQHQIPFKTVVMPIILTVGLI